MAFQKSICFILDELPVTHAPQEAHRERLVEDDGSDDGDIVLTGLDGYKGQCNNLALGSLDFKHVESQLITPRHVPRVGDVCVRLMPIISQSEDYATIVHLYNTYIANGSSLLAKRHIDSYAGTEELSIPVIPIHVLVSEWNKSLQRFHDLIGVDGSSSSGGGGGGGQRTRRQQRMNIVSNVTELALKNVPIVSEHLWFVLHSIVSKPSLVKQVLQLVGSVSSTSGTVCHTDEVQNVTVPGGTAMQAVKLYLIAKSVPATGNNVTVLGDEAGATLGLIWVAVEDELHDHLRNSQRCYYVHLGTQTGNTFRCNGSCDWRYYNHSAFDRMTRVGHEAVLTIGSSALAGNTGDSARLLTQ